MSEANAEPWRRCPIAVFDSYRHVVIDLTPEHAARLIETNPEVQHEVRKWTGQQGMGRLILIDQVLVAQVRREMSEQQTA